MPSRKKLAADAWGSLLRVHAELVPELDRALQAETRLPLSWYDVLLELQAAPDHRLRMRDLADKVVLSRTRVSRLVDEMARGGLVEKREHPEDRRSSYAVLTSAGLTAFQAAAPVYLKSIEDRFAAALTTDDLDHLRRALEAVLDQRSEP